MKGIKQKLESVYAVRGKVREYFPKLFSSIKIRNVKLPGNRRKRLAILLTFIAIVIPVIIFVAFKLASPSLAAWWPNKVNGVPWGQRKQLIVINSSGATISSGTAIAINVDTQSLYNNGKVKADCSDLRIVYQPNSTTSTELTRDIVTPGNVPCNQSTATKVYFQLQTQLANGSTSNLYYAYYFNPQATAPTGTDAVFNVGSKTATLVCPFNGTTTCIAGETPSSSSALRYSGSKSAMLFSGYSDRVEVSNNPDDASQPLTMEAWFKFPNLAANPHTVVANLMGGHFGKGCCTGMTGIGIWLNNGIADSISGSISTDNGVDGGSTGIGADYNFQPNTWYHIAMQVDKAGNMSLYVNGQLVDSGTMDPTQRATSTNFEIGAASTNSNDDFNGLVDEVRVSNIVRYTSNFTPSTAPFIRDAYTKLLYHFDENGLDPRTSNLVPDDSGNGNNGTFQGNSSTPKYVSGLVGDDNGNSDTGVDGPGVFAGHEGVLTEEATTNKITNPSFENSTPGLNWTSGSSVGAITNTSAPYYKFGSSSMELSAYLGSTSYAESNADTDQGIYTSTSYKRVAQGFQILSGTSINNAQIFGRKVSSPTGGIHLEIQTDNSGVPSGTAVTNGISNCIDVSTIGTANYWINFTFSSPPSLSANTQYHLVAKVYTNTGCTTERSSADATNRIAWRYDNSSATYGYGDRSTMNTSNTWTVGSNADLIFNLNAIPFYVAGDDSDQGLYRTTSYKRISQGFQTATAMSVSDAQIYARFNGSTTRYIHLEIQTDNAGLPSDTPVTNGTSACIASTDFSGSNDWNTFFFPTPPSLSANTQYHLVAKVFTNSSCTTERTAIDNTNYFTWRFDNTSSTYPNGTKEQMTDAGVWSSTATADHLFELDSSSYTTSINPGNTNSHTLSAYVYNATPGNIGGNIDWSVAQLVFRGGGQDTTTYTDIGGGWWRLTYSGATANSSEGYGIMVEPNSAIYTEGFQLEEKSYATTYTDGSLGNGYSWSGAANNSTSTRTAGSLTYSTSGNFSNSAGSISIWVKFPVASSDLPASTYYNILNSEANANGDWFNLRYSKYSNSFDFQKFISYIPTTVGVPQTFSANEWLHIVATWSNSSGTALYVDSGTPSTDSNTTMPGALGINIDLAYRLYPEDKTRQTISDFRIFNAALSGSEVADLYNSGLVSHSEGYPVDAFTDAKGQNPYAIWHMDEGMGGVAHDSSIYGNDLTLTNTQWATSSATLSTRKQYLLFNGTGSLASRSHFTHLDFGTGDFSLSGWFRHTPGTTGTQTLLSHYGSAGFKVYMDTTDHICFGIDDDSSWGPDDSACSSTTYPDSNWHHFEVVKSGTTSITLYIDGQQAAQNTSLTAAGSLDTNDTFYLGVDSNGSSNYWAGWIDEITIYPYARNQDQAKADYAGSQVAHVLGSSTTDPLTQGLVGYWKMDDTAPTLGEKNILSSTDNGNLGYIQGQKYTLSQTATVQSMSIYVDTPAGGNVQLGIYSDSGGTPSSRLAYTNTFAAASGWNTVNVTSPTSLSPGNYWLAYATDSNSTTFRSEVSIPHYYASGFTFGSMPATFPSGTADTYHLSLYASFSVNFQDSSGNSNTGTESDSVTSVSGKFGNGVTFSGSNYLQVAGSSSITLGSWTVSAWIYPTSIPGAGVYRTVIAKDGTSTVTNNYSLQIVGSEVNGSYYNNSAWQNVTSNGANLQANKWYHLTYTFDGINNQATLYINGAKNGQTTNTGTPSQNSSTVLQIGNDDANHDYFVGTIDEARVYNQAFSPTEVRQLYNWAPGPVGWWKFNEGSGTTVKDYSGYDDNGILTNSGWRTGKYDSAMTIKNNGLQDVTTVTDPASGILDMTSPLTSYTEEFWAKWNSGNLYVYKGGMSVGDPGYNSALVWGGGARNLQCSFADGTNADNSEALGAVPDSNWHHIACVMDRNGVLGSPRLYILLDGKIIGGTGITTTLTPDNTNNLQIGDLHAGDNFDGAVTDVRIYNYARTLKQIVEDMNAGHPAPGSPIGSPLIHYDFNEGYGDTANNSGNGGSTLNGNLAGTNTCPGNAACPTWTNDGKIGKALSFNGTTNYTQTSSTVDLTGSNIITVSFWLNWNSYANDDKLALESSDNYNNNAGAILIDPNSSSFGGGKFVLSIRGTSYRSESIPRPSAGVWHHYILVFDAVTGDGNITVYVDGTEQATTIEQNGLNAPWNFGNYTWNFMSRNGSSLFGAGKMDEFKLYNFALTADQAKIEYNQGMAQVLGSLSDTSNLTGGSVASNSAAAAYCVPGSSDPCSPPVGEWKFDENTSTTVNDTSGNGHTGTWQGALGNQWKTGKIGGAGNFNGTDNLVTFSDVALSTKNTVEFWINQQGATNSVIVGNAPGIYGAYFDGAASNNSIYYSPTLNDFVSVVHGGLTTGVWYHFAIVRNGTSVTFYKNGAQIGTTQTLASNDDLTVNSLGGHSAGVHFYEQGLIDNVILYNYARTAAQVAWNYNRGKPIAQYDFNECTGATIHNDSLTAANGVADSSLNGTIHPNTGRTTGTCGSGVSTEMWNGGTTGKWNASLAFDGAGDYVSVTDPGTNSALDFSNGQSITLSAWVKPSVLPTDGNYTTILTKGASDGNADGNYVLQYGSVSGNKIIAFCYSDNGSVIDQCYESSSSVMQTNTWQHITFTITFGTGSTAKAYYNGVLQSGSWTTGNGNAGPTVSNKALWIGADQYVGLIPTELVNGQIDDVRIYNYALTATQVKTLFNNNSAVKF